MTSVVMKRGNLETGWGIHINPWLIHVNVWQNPLQYCKVISLQLIKINEKERRTQQEATETQEETPFESEGRNWNDLFTSQWKPAHLSSSLTHRPQCTEAGKSLQILPHSSVKSQPCLNLDCGLLWLGDKKLLLF